MVRKTDNSLVTVSTVQTVAAFEVRRAVFVVEQGISESAERDEDDKRAHHAVLFLDSQPVAVGRVVINKKTAKIGRMAVLANYRKRGFGRRILDALEAIAIGNRVAVLVLSAQKTAVDFYLRAGYEPVGEEYYEAGLPHLQMRKKVPRKE